MDTSCISLKLYASDLMKTHKSFTVTEEFGAVMSTDLLKRNSAQYGQFLISQQPTEQRE